MNVLAIIIWIFKIIHISTSDQLEQITRNFQFFKEPPIETRYDPSVERKWFTQKLDHFNTFNTQKWQMRYFENSKFLTQDGPIFIYVGGEWSITEGWLQTGHMYDMAKQLNGTMFYTEHRYYGQSRPTLTTSVNDLKYLSVDQALADLAYFIVKQKSENRLLKNSGVILVGASYSATMVSWFRLKYPHLANGAWASSAPLLAKLDFIEYKEVMTEAIRKVGGDKCVTRIENAIRAYDTFINTNQARPLEVFLNLCSKLDLSNKMDVWGLMNSISNLLAGIVQYYKGFEIQGICRVITSKNGSDLEAFSEYVRNSNNGCFNFKHSDTVNFLKNTDWNHSANWGTRQWMYQTCAEFGWYQTSGSKNQIFGRNFPVEYFIQYCSDLYDGIFNKTIMEKNERQTNARYGGMRPFMTNVYSTHGEWDPWRPMGIQTDINPKSPATVIPGVAHCADLYSLSNGDYPAMKASKQRIFELVKTWLKN